MQRKSIQTALQLFGRHHGFLRTSDALRLGIQPRTLYQMQEDGLLVKESRGIYRMAGSPEWSDPDLALAALRIPKGVVCLISALHFHGLTTQIPHRIDIALPQGAEKPRLDYPPMRYFWLSPDPYKAGIEQHTLDGISLRIYSPAKTIADCFKFRNRLGLDVALEALRDGLRVRHLSVDEILKYARVDRVEHVIKPYAEALLYE